MTPKSHLVATCQKASGSGSCVEVVQVEDDIQNHCQCQSVKSCGFQAVSTVFTLQNIGQWAGAGYSGCHLRYISIYCKPAWNESQGKYQHNLVRYVGRLLWCGNLGLKGDRLSALCGIR